MVLVVALAGGLLAWSAVTNLVLGERGYLLRNLVATGALLLLADALGIATGELGLQPRRAATGLLSGGVAVAAVVVVLAAGVALADRFRPVAVLLADERAALPPRLLAYHVLLRIPLGTALFEEVAFRGVLLAALTGVAGDGGAVVWSSVVFGLWHVPPTMVTLRINGVAVATPRGLAAVAGAVVVTAVAGSAFAGLRWASGSLLAPILAHWATNAGGILAARGRRDPQGDGPRTA